MRRGHSGVGGWRGDNQRHFRPRGSGAPHFRPSRPFGHLDTPPRYPPPGPRPFRSLRPFGPPPGRLDNVPQPEHHDRNKYRINNLSRSQERGYPNRDRQIPPFQMRQNHNDNEHGGSHTESNFYQNPNQCHINDMGDIDHRRQHQISPWAVPPVFESTRQYYDDHRSPHKTSRHLNRSDDLPDYSGHRPPASDHYTTTTTGPNNNNSQYTHSVDDTVDIIRKRLENRNKQQGPDSSLNHQSNMDEDLRKNPIDNYQDAPQEQPVKKRIQRQKQNIKLNCDKMKNKIVHQLFKMDKVKIHKLMDNPSSSTKFEYAISSLITEGQNSLNRHLRSVAEKSLCSTSTDFIQDDSNTIYEDTFMKQMQGVLDPQDTVLLEDIKPLVMAELSRVLQLDDYQFEAIQDYGIHDQDILNHREYDQEVDDPEMQNPDLIYSPGMPKEEFSNHQYYDEVPITEQYSQDTCIETNQPLDNQNNNEIITGDIDERNFKFEHQSSYESKPLYERRPTSTVVSTDERRQSETRQSRQSIDQAFGYINENSVIDGSSDCVPTIPLFGSNIDQLSDEDDPFAELDKQYHVAVDRNFIENENASRHSSPPLSYTNNTVNSPSCPRPISIIGVANVPANPVNIKKEIDIQLHNIAESPINIKLCPSKNRNETDSKSKTDINVKLEPAPCLEKENLSTPSYDRQERYSTEPDNERSGKTRENKKEAENLESATKTKCVLQSNTRKRSTDQKPCHRKEKRKRNSHSECQEAAKSIINMFYTNEDNKETSKTTKKPDFTGKVYSDKYVKRKESHKKSTSKDSDSSKIDESKKHNSSSHSNLSPKDNFTQETLSKSDSKAKLKPIDIFGEMLKKGSTHQAHRHTGQSPDESKPKPVMPTTISFARKLSKRHIGTQVILKVRSRDCQTEKLKRHDRKTQTDPISINTSKSMATNPLERMKEIDMEIQLLLQEKFKLYNSLETKSMTVPMDSMPSLSMRVFKVNTDQAHEKTQDSEDAIVDDFTNIPSEELEQIALETIEEVKSPVKSDKKNKRQKVAALARLNSESPTMTKPKKKLKSPNISIIEQIITDDRPIEDIICLDDLESTPVKSKKKQQKYHRPIEDMICLDDENNIKVRMKKKQRKALPKKKSTKKLKSTKVNVYTVPYDAEIKYYDIKECSVVLKRINISDYSRPKSEEPPLQHDSRMTFEVPIVGLSPVDNNLRLKSEELSQVIEVPLEEEVVLHNETLEPSLVQVVEEVVNDLQFDMLDVSEDIIIGDNCEVKADDKINEREVITEEIILDNSQSSIEDIPCNAVPENECKTYDYSTNENLQRDAITVTGNADAVLAIECIENDFIAACLDGNVYHFSGDGQLLKTFRGTNQAVTCLTIVQEKYGTTIYTGSLDSRIRYYDLESGVEKGPECNVLSPIQTMDRAWDTIFVGTRTGFVLQFECKNNMLIPVSTVKFSEQSILALRAMKEGARKVLLVAARSENVVTIKDAQTGLLLRTLQGPKMSVYTLLFEDGKVYCGTSSHNIHVFDYSTGTHVWSHEGGKGAVCLLAAGGLVFAGCYDGCVYIFREGEARPRAQLRGPSLMLLSLAVRGTKIIAGYKDRGLYIWKLPLAIVQEMIL